MATHSTLSAHTKASQNVISEGFITLKIIEFVRISMRLPCDKLKIYVHEKGRRYIVPVHCTLYIVRCTLYVVHCKLYIVRVTLPT